MYKFSLGAFACLLMLAACSGSDDKSSTEPSEYDYVWDSESAQLTFPCNEGKEGATAYLKSKDKILVCLKEDGEWIWSDDSAAVAEVVPSSSSKAKSSSSSKGNSSSSARSGSSSSRDPGEMWDITQYLNPEIQYNDFEDPRDGQVYKTVVIGDLEWFAQNLNYDYHKGYQKLSYCLKDSKDSCAKYGRIYQWKYAVDSLGLLSDANINPDYENDHVQGVCPEGWWIPTWAEYYNKLLSYADGYTKDSEYHWKTLLAMKGWLWKTRGIECHGTDVLGFSALPSKGHGTKGEIEFEVFLMWFADHQYETLYGTSGAIIPVDMHSLMSVRCVREVDMSNPPKRTERVVRRGNVEDYFNPDVKYDEFKDERDGQVYKSVKIGPHVWMAQNLNYKVDENTPCGGGINYRVGEEGDCALNGRLYPMDDAYDICPEGWHLPDSLEFESLMDESRADGDTTVIALRGEKGWDVNLYKVLNTSGFTAIPAGRDVSDRSGRVLFHKETGFAAVFFIQNMDPLDDYRDLKTATITTRSVVPLYGKSAMRASIRCVKD